MKGKNILSIIFAHKMSILISLVASICFCDFAYATADSNNSCSSPQTVSLDTYVCPVSVNKTNDPADYFRIAIPSTGKITIELENDKASSTTLQLQVYSPTCGQLPSLQGTWVLGKDYITLTNINVSPSYVYLVFQHWGSESGDCYYCFTVTHYPNTTTSSSSSTTSSLSPGSFRVQVKHSDDSAVTGANLNALQLFMDGIFTGQEPDPASNDYTFNNLTPNHTYRIDAYGTDMLIGQSEEYISSGENANKVLTAKSQGTVQIRTLYSNGVTGFPGVTVQLRSHEGTTWRTGTSGSDGWVSWDGYDRAYVYPNDGPGEQWNAYAFYGGSPVSSAISLDVNAGANLQTTINTTVAPPSFPVTFRAITANSGTHQDTSSSNYFTVSYTYNGTPQTTQVWDGHDSTVNVDAGSSYQYNPIQSSGSTGTHQWVVFSGGSGTLNSSQTISPLIYERYYKPFQAITASPGTSMTLSNGIVLTYKNAGSNYSDVTLYDGTTISQWADAGSTYSYAQESSVSDSTQRWRAATQKTGTVTNENTVSWTYFHQYKPTITLNGTDSSNWVSTDVEYSFGNSVAGGILYGVWGNWCDKGSTLTFGQCTTGTPQKCTTDTRSWTVNSAFSATLNYNIVQKPTLFSADFFNDIEATTGTPILLKAKLEEDSIGHPDIAGENIYFQIYLNSTWQTIQDDDITFTNRITDTNGFGSQYYLCNLNEGNYLIRANYDGDPQYASCSKTSILTVKISSDSIKSTINGNEVGWKLLLNRVPVSSLPQSGNSQKTPLILVHGNGNEDQTEGRWTTFLDYIQGNSDYNNFDVYVWLHDTSKAIGFNGDTGNAAELAACINDYILPGYVPGTRVLFVAHSRGGLVVRSFMNYNNQGDKVLGLITLGTPHHGSPFALPDWTASVYAMQVGNQEAQIFNFNKLVGIDGIFEIDRLGDLNLAWDNMDNAIDHFEADFNVAFSFNGQVFLTSKDTNKNDTYSDQTILYSDSYKNYFGTLFNLNENESYHNKIVTIGAYDEELTEEDWNAFYLWLAELVTPSDLSDHNNLRYTTKLLAYFSYTSDPDISIVTNDSVYFANDGLVPIQSALFLNISDGNGFCSLTDRNVNLNIPAIDLYNQVKRTHFFRKHLDGIGDHLDLLDTSHQEYWNLITDEINNFIPPKTPTLTLPADNAQLSTLTPQFQWSAFQSDSPIASESGYQLRVRCDDEGDAIIYDTGFVPTNSANSHTYNPGAYIGYDSVADVTRISNSLEWGKHYHWHVRYRDQDGNWSFWSADTPTTHQDFYTISPSGSLQVTLEPPEAVSAGAQWNVDGGAWQNSGATVSELSVGDHTVNYKAVTCWTAPPSETVAITLDQTTDITRNYTAQTGCLQITLGPAEAVAAGAQWNVDGGAWQNSGATVCELSTGNHTVSYKPIAGWIAPADETISISCGETTNKTRNYAVPDGSLKVTLSPSGAVAAGAQWNVDGGAWHNTGDIVNDLTVGNHTVNYKTLTCWTSPPSESVAINLDEETNITRNYTEQTGCLSVTLGPPEAVVAGAQWNVDGGAWQDSGVPVCGLIAGSHTVNYKVIPGWVAPVSEAISISCSITTQISRTYNTQSTNKLPDTGQSKCYNASGEIPCPAAGQAFYGQDSQYGPNTQSYTKLDATGNELPDSAPTWAMVRENLTGLIWENKTDDESIHDKDNTYNWQNAQNVFIAQLNASRFGGFDNWRLPTIAELSSIVDSNVYNPTISTYFANTMPGYYWSSTESYTVDARYVRFDDGVSCDRNKSNYSHYVRAVRGEPLSHNFQDNVDGTVTDTSTGLMWQQATAPGTYTWEQALNYCETLPLAGYDDWRLPNKNELQTLIVDYLGFNTQWDNTNFPDTTATNYWTSTTFASSPSDAWMVDFNWGCIINNAKSASWKVRAVRGGQTAPCSISLDTASATHPAGGITGATVSFTATDSGCPWTATSNSAWITDITPTSGTGNGAVSYTVTTNESTSPRTGTITIAGLTFTINQSGVTCTDTDLDGYYSESACGPADCNDSDPDIHPGATEICDGIDNNCIDGIDEDFSNKGETCTAGVGACERQGTYVCSGDGLGTVCNVTPGSPSAEICDGIDNDCNELTDEGLGQSTCGQGVCSHTVQNCVGGVPQTCNPMEGASAEVCDNLDNDCDGIIDNNPVDGQTYYRDEDGDGYGDPNNSIFVCSQPSGYVTDNTDFDDTDAARYPGAPELCDGKDNNNNGQTDEGFNVGGQCFSEGVGLCRHEGVYVCSEDKLGIVCNAVPGIPGSEFCDDGLDNDCDGLTDCADSACASDQSCPEGLLGYWKFEEGSGTVAVDSSANGNNGTVNGGAQWVGGASGGALSFDGTDDYVQLPNEPIFKFGTASFSISTWIKTTSTRYSEVFMKYDGLQGYFIEYSPAAKANGIRFAVNNRYLVSGTAVGDGNWHMITCIREAHESDATFKLYIDGKLDASGSFPLESDNLDMAPRIGADSRNLDYCFTGSIDETRLYGRALTEAEIRELMLIGPVPDTGQTQTYTETFGEDHDYIINPPSYTKLDSSGFILPITATSWSMVRDNITGLLWENKLDDGQIHDKDTTYTWQNAQDVFISQLNADYFGGYNDWRLPTVKELSQIVHRDTSNPAINSVFQNTVSLFYWTSTGYAGNSINAWSVGFDIGNVLGTHAAKTDLLPARAVRGATLENKFIDNQDGTITDTTTGLMWQQDGTTQKTWEQALADCENSDLAGHSDWRMPSFNEMQSIMDYTRVLPAIDQSIFPDPASVTYWTSTTNIAEPSKAWCFVLDAGYTNTVNKTAICNLRAVRGGNITPCAYEITPTSDLFGESGGSGVINVTAQGGCAWTAAITDTWITGIPPTSGTGNGAVGYTVAANESTSPRSGTINIAGQIFTVNQSGVTCTDIDEDGYYIESACGPVDCNDNDPAIYPGATELCDGKDNQCPGEVGYGQIDEDPLASEDCNNRDNKFCNGEERCEFGICVSGSPPDCLDGIDCTVDSCNPGTDACQHISDNGLCDDGRQCTDNICDQISGCQNPNLIDGTPCIDGNACTEVDICSNGDCIGTAPKDCGDGKDCTDDDCDEATGACLHDCAATGAGDPCCDIPECITEPLCQSSGYWKFDEESGTVATDSSLNANNGTIYGGALRTAAGACGKALVFDGVDDYVKLPTAVINFGTSPFAVSAYIKTAVSGTGTIYMRVSTLNNGIAVTLNGDKLRFATSYNGQTSEITGIKGVADGMWHHIACVRESDGTLKIYVDGALDKAETLPILNDSASASPRIGCDSRSLTGLFNGTIDEMRIYGRALTQTEVQGLKNKCVPDSDNDGIPDDEDNCPGKANGPELGTCSATSDKPNVNCSSDADCVIGCSSNGLCLKTQDDNDNDGVGDLCDNCPTDCNSQQLDADSDSIGDVCDDPNNDGCGGCSEPVCEQQCL